MSYLAEGMEYKCLDGLVKNLVAIDEFSSKMGSDSDIVVVSFYVRDHKAAKDLAHWFEGYTEILDADVSPGEIKPNRYLVYIELRRRSNVGKIMNRILGDLDSLTEFEPDDWEMRYEDRTLPWNRETFEEVVPLSPERYRETHEEELNEMRRAAGIDERRIYDDYSEAAKEMQRVAGIL